MDSDPFLGEIRMFAFDYAPADWAPCNGQPRQTSGPLSAILGNYTYAPGDYRLPDLQGRVPMHRSNGRGWGLHGGSETVTLSNDELPAHQHSIRAAIPPGTLNTPASDRTLARASGGSAYQTSDANLVKLNNQTLGLPGARQPHNNMQPYLTLNFCIALIGQPPTG